MILRLPLTCAYVRARERERGPNPDHNHYILNRNPPSVVVNYSRKLTPEQEQALLADLARGDTYATVQQRYGISKGTVHAIRHRHASPAQPVNSAGIPETPAPRTNPEPSIPISALADLERTHAADAEALEKAQAELERMRREEAKSGESASQGEEPRTEPPKKSAREITAESLYATIDNAQLKEILTATAKIGAGNVAQCLEVGAQLIYDYWPVARLQGYEEGHTKQFLADLFNFWAQWKDRLAEYEEGKAKIEAYERMRAYVAISRIRGHTPDYGVLLAALAAPTVDIIEMVL